MNPQFNIPCPFQGGNGLPTSHAILGLNICVEAFNLHTQRCPGTIESTPVVDALNTILNALEDACTCCHSKSPCLTLFGQIRTQISSFHVPLKHQGKIDLSNNRLKDLLDEIYLTLPCKGPEYQTPEQVRNPVSFYCPFCFRKRGRWSDMRIHLRGDHKVENNLLNELFPTDRNTKYLQCFGGFTPDQASRNGTKRTSSSRGESSSQISATPGLEDHSLQDDLPQDQDLQNVDPSGDLAGFGFQHTYGEIELAPVEAGNDNSALIALDPRPSPGPLHERSRLHGQYEPPLHASFAQPAAPIGRRHSTRHSRGPTQGSFSTESWLSPPGIYSTFSATRSSRSYDQSFRPSDQPP